MKKLLKKTGLSKQLIMKMDLPLLFFSTLLTLFGLLMVFSSSSVSTLLRYGLTVGHFFQNQLFFIVLAYSVGFIFVIAYPTKKYNKFLIPAAVAGILSLVLLYPLGDEINSARSWYDLGFFSLQPAEFMKSLIIITFAIYYNTLNYQKAKNFALYLIPLAYAVVCSLLIFFQPDLGSAVIVGSLAFAIFLFTPGVNDSKNRLFKFIVGLICLFSIALLIIGPNILAGYQSDRLNYTDPCTRYTEVTGYQVCNGFIAMQNGGLWGTGLGDSTQKYLYLPESHTDFIFPVVVEELGLIVAGLVLIVYGIIMFRLIKISKEAANLKGSIIAFGAFMLIFIHLVINLSGILALMPLTGISMPLLSYGGSSTINFILIIFVAQRVAIEAKEDKLRRDIKASLK